MFCFLTDFLHNQMKSHPEIGDGVERFQERIAEADNAEEAKKIFSADQYLPHPFLRHRISKQTRLVGKVMQWEGEEIVVLYRVLLKGGSGDDSYSRFESRYQQDKERALNKLERLLDQSKDRLRSEFAEWRKQQGDEKRPLPEGCKTWMRPPQWRIGATGTSKLILETDAWSHTVNESDEWPIYWQVLETILLSAMEEEPTSLGSSVERAAGYEHTYVGNWEARYVLFARVDLKYSDDRLTRTAVLLIQAFEEVPSDAEIRRTIEEQGLERLLDRIEEGEGSIPATELIPNAVRAYPEDVAENRDTWGKILKNEEEANLALSPEESQVLEQVGSRSSDHWLPLFINGRAGSGKSTMLLYLFADYCHRRLRSDENRGDPIFITYSERLLEQAKQTVLNRLNCNAEYVRSHHGEEKHEEIEESDIAPFFSSFQDLLRRQLPADRRTEFHSSGRVTYAAFKEAYHEECQLPEAKKISPGLAWHVIRTFIKGYKGDGPLTPSQYQDLPREDRRWISDESYEKVYDKIYNWYEGYLSETDRWDDQDLVREVLKADGLETRPVVFCDEAQDFTRIELDLLRRLSTFSHYDFDLYETNYLPFAFAGDPLQTLNPTGFRWARLKSRVHDQLVEKLPSETSGTTVDEIQLEFNYRSKAPIVHVCNLILGWRQHLFGGSLKPQRAWSSIGSDDNEPRLYILDTETDDTHSRPDDSVSFVSPVEMGAFLKEGRTIIVPCEEGREIEYVKSDDFLREHIRWEEASDRPVQDLMTAVEAKGLDLDQVIVYGFGDFADRHGFVEGLSAPSSTANQERLEESYFFNRLYVALSRAVNELVIVDPPSGAAFWDAINNVDFIANQEGSDFEVRPDLYDLDPVESREPYISAIPLGEKNDLQALSDPDQLRDARNFFQRGLEEKSARRMARAAQKFRAVEENGRAREADAFRHKFKAADASDPEERRTTFKEAGDTFQEIGRYREALESFWEAHAWDEYKRLATERRMREENPGRYTVAQFMSDPTTHFATFLENIEAERLPDGTEQLDGAANALEEVGREKLKANDSSEELARRLSEALFRLSGVVSTEEERELEEAGAEFLYRTGDLESVIEICLERGLVDSIHYRFARAKDVGYPEGLEHIAEIPDGGSQYLLRVWDDLLDEHDVATDLARRREFILTLSEPEVWSEYLAELLNRSQRYAEAFWLHVAAGQTRPAVSNLEQMLGQSESDYDDLECLKAMVDLLTEERAWQDLVDVVNGEHGYVPKDMRKELRTHAVRALADTEPGLEITDKPQRFFRRWAKTWIEEGANPVLAGLALERIGHFKTMVEFYERYIGSENDRLRRYARKRLVASLDRWSDFERERGNRKTADQREQRKNELIQAWEGDPGRFRSSKTMSLDQSDAIEALKSVKDGGEAVDQEPRSLEASGDESEAVVEEESSTPSPQQDDSPSPRESSVGTSRTESEQGIDEVNLSIEVKRTDESHRLWLRYEDTDDGLVVDLNEARVASNGFVDLDRNHDGEKIHFHLEADGKPTVEGVLIKENPPVLEVEVEGLEHTIRVGT